MRDEQPMPIIRRGLALLPLLGLLSACKSAVLDPAGDIALQQRDIIYISTALMLLIIVPVIALIITFAWRYRKGNNATYDPDFDHSTALELVIWSAPLMIIICLGALTWWSTHLLDPFRPLNRISATKPIDPRVKPLTIQVVSLDWKWLFIYPEQGIATVNELALPVDRPVRFDMTSTNMMNTFYPQTLAGMIYTMPGMRSTLHAVINKPGTFEGMSANYSGAGFSDMRFKLYGVSPAQFDAWVARVKQSRSTLDTNTYLAVEKPSERVPAMYFSGVDPALFDRIYNRCAHPGTPCMRDTMHRDSMPKAPAIEGAPLRQGEARQAGVNSTRPSEPGKPVEAPPGSHMDHHMSFNLLPAVPGVARASAA
jgi:cytochrome o ubiquinol oxidase subunit 2